ncbi:hypothetical protein [Sphaerisporangium fuscum]|uniref:hypothetical protein n=1 Tax=Sphaerisporangium fuscum TaxID=2835868 RepID=UPI001BDCE160|nr:hypothetical protein [Sphaerisporangium fuscum]
MQITVTTLAGAAHAAAAAPGGPDAGLPRALRERPNQPGAQRLRRYSPAQALLAAPGAGKQARQAGSAFLISPALWRQHLQYREVRLSHRQAAWRLRQEGLRRRSSGHCANRHRPSCTSLDSVRLGTLWGVVDLKRRSGCRILVTGGTEVGHAGGRRSHGQGYKLDVAHNRCVDRFVRGRSPGRVRGDGARLFYENRPEGRTVYADEPSHWDITFT